MWVSPGGIPSVLVGHPSPLSLLCFTELPFPILCWNAVSPVALRDTVTKAPVPSKCLVAPCPVTCRSLGGKTLFPLCHVLIEDSPRQANEALVFLFSKVLSLFTFLHGELGSETCADDKYHSGLRTLHLQCPQLMLRFCANFMFNRRSPRPCQQYQASSWRINRGCLTCSRVHSRVDVERLSVETSTGPQHQTRPLCGQNGSRQRVHSVVTRKIGQKLNVV